MINKLFIICPFSNMEIFLQEIYGNEIFFLTYTGAVLQLQDIDYLSEVKNFILREKINYIYIVNDTSCIFINGIIKAKRVSEFSSQKEMEDLYIDSYFQDFKDMPIQHQQFKLAELNVKKQAFKILNTNIFADSISISSIVIKGIVTNKQKKLSKEIIILNKESKSYEL